MALDSFFIEQFDQIRDFMVSPGEAVRFVRIDAEMKPMFLRALDRMEDAADFPHVFLYRSTKFKEPLAYFNGLLQFLEGEFKQHAAELAECDIQLDAPASTGRQPRSPRRFLNHAHSVAQNLPDSVGSLVFVLDPGKIKNQKAWRKSVQFLISKIHSRWLKFLILDSRVSPVIGELEDEKAKMKIQTFYLGPKEMESRASQDIEAPDAMDTAAGRQTLGLLAGFAHGRKDYDKAEELQRRWLEESKNKGDPGEIATAWYNLGNTLLEKASLEEATEAYCSASIICRENQLNELSPFVFTNLGVALHRQGAFKQAFDSLRVARDLFKAQGQLPGRVHVIDTLAGMYALDGRNRKAEETWLYALNLYRKITAKQFSELSENGSREIIKKLERFYRDTGQDEKINTLSQPS